MQPLCKGHLTPRGHDPQMENYCFRGQCDSQGGNFRNEIISLIKDLGASCPLHQREYVEGTVYDTRSGPLAFVEPTKAAGLCSMPLGKDSSTV